MNAVPNGSTVSSSWTRDLFLVGILSGLVFFLFLGVRPLSNPDEGRYSEIPREMVATHDFVTPRLDGVKYFEKPPLLYWVSATAFSVFGFNEWSTRLGVALFATLGALLVYAAGRVNFGREAALWSTAVLSTCLLYYGLSRVTLLDLPVGVLMAAALWAFQIGIELPPTEKRRALFGCVYLAMGLAVLTKGLIGFLLPGLVMACWVTLLNRWRNLRPFYPVSGTLLFLAVALPWHVLAARANADFLNFYFIHEQFLRFTTDLHDRNQPGWYFLPVILVGLFPWTVFLVQAVRHHLRGGWSARNQHAVSWFLILWVVLITAFFSKSHSKLIPYVAPVFPALALLLGSFFAHAFQHKQTRGLRIGLLVFSGFCFVLSAALLLPHLPIKPAELALAVSPWRKGLAILFLVGGAAVATLTWKNALRAAFVALILTTLGFNFSVNFIAGLVDTRSTKTLALALRPRLQASDRVYCLGNYSQDFPVYLDRLVDLVDFEGELAFGRASEPEKTASRFLDRTAFLARWNGKETAYALVSRRDLPRYFSLSLSPTIVAENARYLVLTNQSP